MILTTVGNAPVTGSSEAFGLSEDGRVVGQEDATFPFLWTPTTPNAASGASQRLPTFSMAGPADATATATNAGGDVVGFADMTDASGAQVTRAVIWLAGAGTVQELGTLTPDPFNAGAFLGNSKAMAINDAGVVVGVSDTSIGVEHAFAFDPANNFMQDLGSLVPLSMVPAVPDPSQALGINSQGDIVGEAAALDGQGGTVARAFLLAAGTFSMVDLGTHLPDSQGPGGFIGDSVAFAINDSGLVVGSAAAGDPAAPVQAPAIFQAGMPPSGPFPAEGKAVAVSSSGVIVGTTGQPPAAFVFDSVSGALDLTSQQGGPPPDIAHAVGVNAAGQIAVITSGGSGTEAALLTP